MSFYSDINKVVLSENGCGYAPVKCKPNFLDTWKAGFLVFLITLTILIGLLLVFKPKKQKNHSFPVVKIELKK